MIAKMKNLLFLLIVFLLCSTILYADTIYLKGGRSIEGEIIKETEESVTVRKKFTGGSVETGIPRLEIDRIESDYRIVEEVDISMKALTQPLSSYTTEELVDLPVNIRKKYGILVAPNLSKEEYIEIFNNIIIDITRKNNDIDEISLWVYDDKDALLNSSYNVARVLWCPNGEWAYSVTPEIATSNNRDSYRVKIDWSPEYEYKFSGRTQAIEQDEREVSPYGFGDVKFGMLRQEVKEILQKKGKWILEESCTYRDKLFDESIYVVHDFCPFTGECMEITIYFRNPSGYDSAKLFIRIGEALTLKYGDAENISTTSDYATWSIESLIITLMIGRGGHVHLIYADKNLVENSKMMQKMHEIMIDKKDKDRL